MDHPFHKRVVDLITSDTRQVFESLKPRLYMPGAKPQDHPETVLLVKHSGRIQVGSRPYIISQNYGIPGQHVVGNVQLTPVGGKKAWQTFWGMKATQDHKVTYEFRIRQGDSYRRGHRWTVKLPKAVLDGGGRQIHEVLITIHSQPADGKIDKSPKCPMTNKQAIAVALERTEPRRFRGRILTGLLNAQLGKFTVPPAHPNAPRLTTHSLKMTLPIRLKNNMPWPLERIDLSAFFELPTGLDFRLEDQLLSGTPRFEPPLAPGRELTFDLKGKPRGTHRFTDDELAIYGFRIKE